VKNNPGAVLHRGKNNPGAVLPPDEKNGGKTTTPTQKSFSPHVLVVPLYAQKIFVDVKIVCWPKTCSFTLKCF